LPWSHQKIEAKENRALYLEQREAFHEASARHRCEKELHVRWKEMHTNMRETKLKKEEELQQREEALIKQEEELMIPLT
jgi:hypothetical protein